MHEQLALARLQASGASRLHEALEMGAAAQNERHQLLVRGEGLMREELSRAAVENEGLRTRLWQTAQLLATNERLVAHLGDRLDAQTELARVQIGLPAIKMAGNGSKLSAAPASDVANPPPRLVRLRIAAASGDSSAVVAVGGGTGFAAVEKKRDISAARLEAALRADAAFADEESDDESWKARNKGGGADGGAQATGSSSSTAHDKVLHTAGAGFASFSLDDSADEPDGSKTMWWQQDGALDGMAVGKNDVEAKATATVERSKSPKSPSRGVSFRRRLSNYEYEVPDQP